MDLDTVKVNKMSRDSDHKVANRIPSVQDYNLNTSKTNVGSPFSEHLLESTESRNHRFTPSGLPETNSTSLNRVNQALDSFNILRNPNEISGSAVASDRIMLDLGIHNSQTERSAQVQPFMSTEHLSIKIVLPDRNRINYLCENRTLRPRSLRTASKSSIPENENTGIQISGEHDILDSDNGNMSSAQKFSEYIGRSGKQDIPSLLNRTSSLMSVKEILNLSQTMRRKISDSLPRDEVFVSSDETSRNVNIQTPVKLGSDTHDSVKDILKRSAEIRATGRQDIPSILVRSTSLLSVKEILKFSAEMRRKAIVSLSSEDAGLSRDDAAKNIDNQRGGSTRGSMHGTVSPVNSEATEEQSDEMNDSFVTTSNNDPFIGSDQISTVSEIDNETEISYENDADMSYDNDAFMPCDNYAEMSYVDEFPIGPQYDDAIKSGCGLSEAQRLRVKFCSTPLTERYRENYRLGKGSVTCTTNTFNIYDIQSIKTEDETTRELDPDNLYDSDDFEGEPPNSSETDSTSIMGENLQDYDLKAISRDIDIGVEEKIPEYLSDMSDYENCGLANRHADLKNLTLYETIETIEDFDNLGVALRAESDFGLEMGVISQPICFATESSESVDGDVSFEMDNGNDELVGSTVVEAESKGTFDYSIVNTRSSEQLAVTPTFEAVVSSLVDPAILSNIVCIDQTLDVNSVAVSAIAAHHLNSDIRERIIQAGPVVNKNKQGDTKSLTDVPYTDSDELTTSNRVTASGTHRLIHQAAGTDQTKCEDQAESTIRETPDRTFTTSHDGIINDSNISSPADIPTNLGYSEDLKEQSNEGDVISVKNDDTEQKPGVQIIDQSRGRHDDNKIQYVDNRGFSAVDTIVRTREEPNRFVVQENKDNSSIKINPQNIELDVNNSRLEVADGIEANYKKQKHSSAPLLQKTETREIETQTSDNDVDYNVGSSPRTVVDGMSSVKDNQYHFDDGVTLEKPRETTLELQMNDLLDDRRQVKQYENEEGQYKNGHENCDRGYLVTLDKQHSEFEVHKPESKSGEYPEGNVSTTNHNDKSEVATTDIDNARLRIPEDKKKIKKSRGKKNQKKPADVIKDNDFSDNNTDANESMNLCLTKTEEAVETIQKRLYSKEVISDKTLSTADNLMSNGNELVDQNDILCSSVRKSKLDIKTKSDELSSIKPNDEQGNVLHIKNKNVPRPQEIPKNVQADYRDPESLASGKCDAHLITETGASDEIENTSSTEDLDYIKADELVEPSVAFDSTFDETIKVQVNDEHSSDVCYGDEKQIRLPVVIEAENNTNETNNKARTLVSRQESYNPFEVVLESEASEFESESVSTVVDLDLEFSQITELFAGLALSVVSDKTNVTQSEVKILPEPNAANGDLLQSPTKSPKKKKISKSSKRLNAHKVEIKYDDASKNKFHLQNINNQTEKLDRGTVNEDKSYSSASLDKKIDEKVNETETGECQLVLNLKDLNIECQDSDTRLVLKQVAEKNAPVLQYIIDSTKGKVGESSDTVYNATRHSNLISSDSNENLELHVHLATSHTDHNRIQETDEVGDPVKVTKLFVVLFAWGLVALQVHSHHIAVGHVCCWHVVQLLFHLLLECSSVLGDYVVVLWFYVILNFFIIFSVCHEQN